MQRLDLGDVEFDFAFRHQLAHLVDAVRRGAEAVAMMDKCQLLANGARLIVQSRAESPPPAIRIFLPRKVSILRTA